VDEVLRVVYHHDFEVNSVPPFVFGHAAMDGVQAVTLTRGSVVRAFDHVNAIMAARHLGHRSLGEVVVQIDPHEYVVIAVCDGREIMFQHPPDDAMFPPERHKHRDAALRSLFELVRLRPAKPRLRKDEVHRADEELILIRSQACGSIAVPSRLGR
jgi:hypothetical protein